MNILSRKSYQSQKTAPSGRNRPRKRGEGGLFGWVVFLLLLCSCSMTRNIPEDDQLFTGLKPIVYVDDSAANDTFDLHLDATKQEVEAALATKPNGALFGSSYHRIPWSWRLWVYNKYANSTSSFGRWIGKTFGRAPVLISSVNPALRASVARSVLRNNGYFRASVDYQTVTQRNPKKAKIAYNVKLDTLFIIDTISYENFPTTARQLIDSTAEEACITPRQPFTIASLEEERTRLSDLFLNNGYYYYQQGYASYVADTIAHEGKVQLRLQLADGVPDEALRPWYIGHTDIRLQYNRRDQLTNSLHRRHTDIWFKGRHSPILPRIVLKNIRLRHGNLFSYDKYKETITKLNATGIFSNISMQFKEVRGEGQEVRDKGQETPDTLDITLDCTFDKPYDFYVETNLIGRTIGRYGPEMKVGITRRNAFRGAEKLDINLHGSYEWQTRGDTRNSSYQYGADIAVEFPRIIAPFYNSDRRRRDQPGVRRRQRFYNTPTTTAKVSSDIIRRPKYYKMHIVTGEWTYRWQTSEYSRHELSPLTLKYQYMNSHTEAFDTLLVHNIYMAASLSDVFIPKMRYTYIYTSPQTHRHPIRWESTIEEAGNVTALYDLACGHSWNQKEKTLFKNPYSQFVRFETDLTKTWTTGSHSTLVAHANAGIIYSYGNSNGSPFSEAFYAGGANSIRAFPVRGIGPGGFVDHWGNKQFSYLLQNGEIKFVTNLEYRTRLFGSLHGALFVDAGNVWLMTPYDEEGNPNDPEETASLKLFNEMSKEWTFKFSRLLDQTALGTGVGLRYDLGFLVVRLDWGIALHCPYNTGHSGYLNIPSFRKAQTLHFAVGYPF